MSKSGRIVSGTAALAIAGVSLAILPQSSFAALEEIVVSVRKKEENLQNVPLSVQTFSVQEINERGISNIADVAKYTPGIILDKGNTPNDNRIVIRGLSPTRGRANAAILVDGIDVTSEAVNFAGGGATANQRLLDLERIEIVKGPQSALYGRSAFAGAVQYVTRDPGDEFEAEVAADIATDDYYELKAAAGGPITDTFGLRANGVFWSDDGFYEDDLTGDDTGGGEGYGVGVTGLFEPSDELRIKGRLEYTDDEYDVRAVSFLPFNELVPAAADGCAAGIFGPSFCDATSPFYIPGIPLRFGELPDADGLSPTQSPNPRTGKSYPGSESDQLRASLIVDWEVGPGTLTSLTGLTDAEDSFFTDADLDRTIDPMFGPGDVSARGIEYDYENETQQISQEIRYATDLDGAWNFTVGALYWDEDVDTTSQNLSWVSAFFDFVPYYFGGTPTSTVLPLVDKRPVEWGRETQHWSVYGLAEWQINDEWAVTLEGRYAEEDIDYTGPISVCDPATSPFPCFEFPSLVYSDFMGGYFVQPVGKGKDSIDDDYFTPRASVEWQPADNTLYYASVAKGVKPAGIATLTSGTFMDVNGDGTFEEFYFDQEELWSYEIGAKTDWLDGALIVNGDIFFQDYTDRQVSTREIAPSGLPFGTIDNAGEAEVWGIELDTRWAINDNWSATLAYAWLDAEYEKFEFNSTSALAVAKAGNVCNPSADGLCQLNYNGNEMEDVPEHSVVVTGRYDDQVAFMADASWFAEIDGIYQSERYLSPANNIELGSWFRSNLRIGLMKDEWDVIFYVENLFDDDAPLSAQELPGDPDGERVGPSTGQPFANWDFAGIPSDSAFINLPDERRFGLRAAYRF